MSVLDYRENEAFSDYERRVVSMFMEEYCHGEDFRFLEDVDIDGVDMRWYSDRSEKVLGGFYYFQGNRIYLNREYARSCDTGTWAGRMNRVCLMFPVIIHELCHYWQSRHYGLLYLLLQIPVIREFTIETQAYRIQNVLYDCRELNGGSLAYFAKLKRRHGFEQRYFDEIELKMLEKEDLKSNS